MMKSNFLSLDKSNDFFGSPKQDNLLHSGQHFAHFVWKVDFAYHFANAVGIQHN